MAWDPIRQHKFVARKDKFDLDDNIRLDKVRHERSEKKKVTVQVWSLLAISIVILLAAFIVPGAANTAVSVRHTDALSDANKTKELILETNLSMPDDDTLFVVEEAGRYFVFWYQEGARQLDVDDNDDEDEGEKYYGLVEISDPGKNILPINVKEGMSLVYPFKEEPICTLDDGRFALAEGLQILSGHKLVSFDANDEMRELQKDNVKIYKVVAK